MFSVTENSNRIDCTTSTSTAAVDRIDATFRAFAAQADPAAQWTPLQMVLRELVLNAAEHGNRNDPAKSIVCSLERIGEARYQLDIQDQGNGFDTGILEASMAPEPSQPRNRGYAIVRAHADEVRFSDRGRHVTVYVTLPRPVTFAVADAGDGRTIVPNGDITASTAEELRALLLDWVQSPLPRLELDFRNVESIDSIILSVLVSFANTLAKTGRAGVVLTHVGPDLQNLFFLTRVNRLFDIRGKNGDNVTRTATQGA